MDRELRGTDREEFPEKGGTELSVPAGVTGRIEILIAGVAIALLVGLPLADLLLRKLRGAGVPGAAGYEQHLTLWLTFLGGLLAARYGRHLKLSTQVFLPPGRWLQAAQIFTTGVTVLVNLALAYAAYRLVEAQYDSTEILAGGVPVWTAQLIMPAGFAAMALRFWWQSPGAWKGRALVAAFLGAAWAAWGLGLQGELLLWPGLAGLLLAVLLGAPIFVALGGLALLLFFSAGEPVAAVAASIYDLTVSPILPTIPLFALAGTILATGGASGRLVGLFRGLAGWIPGGTAVAAVAVCAFFTAFTGASGVTILALGGLLLPILLKEHYTKKFSVGLLTVSGSIGMFPPNLPLILYGIYAKVDIPTLFLAAFVPSLLQVGVVAFYGARKGVQSGVRRTPFELQRVWDALKIAKWEVFLPVFVLLSIFTGVATLVEAAALTAAYAFFLEVVVHRTIRLNRQVLRMLAETAVLFGALLIVLAVALGLTSYLVDAQIPMLAAEWVHSHVGSAILFLLLLNLFLIAVGALMDIFSAIVVVVPLILPMGAVFGIDPIHLGIIFLANMELGYITPPVGLNLFLSSLRFGTPLVQVWRMVLPFLVLFAIWVLLITYVPALSLTLPRLLGF